MYYGSLKEAAMEEEEQLDPRIQVELEKLNTATDDINKLEAKLEEANNTFRTTLTESTARLNGLAKKLGGCVEKSRPYYRALEEARSSQLDCQRAAVQYQRANAVHHAAKETIALAEKRFVNCHDEKWEFDSAWQEMLNHATMKVMEAEAQKAASEREHMRRAATFTQAEQRVQQLQRGLRSSINKSLVYFDEKANVQLQLEAQKERVQQLQRLIASSKNTYAQSLRSLEQISEEIHEARRCRLPREPGVGAELTPPEPSDVPAPPQHTTAPTPLEEITAREEKYWETLRKKLEQIKTLEDKEATTDNEGGTDLDSLEVKERTVTGSSCASQVEEERTLGVGVGSGEVEGERTLGVGVGSGEVEGKRSGEVGERTQGVGVGSGEVEGKRSGEAGERTQGVGVGSVEVEGERTKGKGVGCGDVTEAERIKYEDKAKVVSGVNNEGCDSGVNEKVVSMEIKIVKDEGEVGDMERVVSGESSYGSDSDEVQSPVEREVGDMERVVSGESNHGSESDEVQSPVEMEDICLTFDGDENANPDQKKELLEVDHESTTHASTVRRSPIGGDLLPVRDGSEVDKSTNEVEFNGQGENVNRKVRESGNEEDEQVIIVDVDDEDDDKGEH